MTLRVRWGWTGNGQWLQVEGAEPVLLATRFEFSMIPGTERGPWCELEPDEGWVDAIPLDVVADFQHSLPGKERLHAYGGPKPKPVVESPSSEDSDKNV